MNTNTKPTYEETVEWLRAQADSILNGHLRDADTWAVKQIAHKLRIVVKDHVRATVPRGEWVKADRFYRMEILNDITDLGVATTKDIGYAWAKTLNDWLGSAGGDHWKPEHDKVDMLRERFVLGG